MTDPTSSRPGARTQPQLQTPSPAEPQRDRPWILALTRNGHMSEPVMSYVVQLAHRLGCGILAVHVDTLPLVNEGKRSRLFAAAVGESVALLQERIAENNTSPDGRKPIQRIFAQYELVVRQSAPAIA